MGRWNYEMSQINFFVRTLVRLAWGTDLPHGSQQEALRHYEQAMQLNPKRLIHQVEAGRVYYHQVCVVGGYS